MGKPTTGKYTQKKYKCTACGHEGLHGTNHYGDIYPRCTKCGWMRPMEMGQVHVCLEPVPEDMGVPEPWKTVKLGDICKITVIHGEEPHESAIA
jgi:DNA-directed RNA polymerase subunit RPC12/RpoP